MTSAEDEDGPPFVDLCAAAEVPAGEVVAFEAQDRRLLVCNADGAFYAIAERCSHAAWDLAGSELRGTEVVCALHGARFDLRTGAATCRPASKPIGTYPTRVRNGRVEARVPPLPR